MRKGRTALLVVLATIPLAVGPGSPTAAGELDRFRGLTGTINIAGGTAHVPVMTEAARRIMTAYPSIRIAVAAGGTGVGVQKVGEGLVDIGNSGRALTAEEVARYGLVSVPLALDGVAPIAHPKNPVTGLTTAEIRGIFAGTIANWDEVGGGSSPIHRYTRDEASGTREVFWKGILGEGPVTSAANVVASNGAMKSAVARNEQAVGYISIGLVDDTVKPLRVDGVAPTQENARNGTYPVVRTLYANTRGAPSGLAKAFLDYLGGPEGAQIIRQSGYLPLR